MDPSMITPEMMAQAQKMMANMTPDQMVRDRTPRISRILHPVNIPRLPADFFRWEVRACPDRHDPRVYVPNTDLDPSPTHIDTIAGADAAHGREHGRRQHALHASRSRGGGQDAVPECCERSRLKVHGPNSLPYTDRFRLRARPLELQLLQCRHSTAPARFTACPAMSWASAA